MLKRQQRRRRRHSDKANHVTTNIGRWTLLEGSTLFPQTPRFFATVLLLPHHPLLEKFKLHQRRGHDR